MPQLASATIGAELSSRINSLLTQNTRYVDPDEFAFKRLAVDVEKLARVNAVEGWLCRALLSCAAGDIDTCHHACDNVVRLNDRVRAEEMRFVCMSNLGYASAASETLGREASVASGTARMYLGLGTINASFTAVIRLMAECQLGSIELSEHHREVWEKAMNANKVLDRLGLHESDVAAILDVAGEVMRKHRLFWHGNSPRIDVLDDAAGASLVYWYRVDASPAQAVAMTDEVIEQMIDRDLDRPGLAVSFLPCS